MQSEIDAFFAGADTWDFIIMGMILLLLFRFVKRIFLIVLFAVGIYFFIHYYGKS